MGEGSLLLQCLEHWRGEGLGVLGVASGDASVGEWAESEGIPFVFSDPLDPRASLSRIEAAVAEREFDFLFSIANPLLLSSGLLSRAAKMAINYHDAPLPRYAGVHATSWAILNGEGRHGVSWHVMDAEADTGDILVQRTFGIRDDDSAFSLNTRCYEEALSGFRALVDSLISGTVTRVKQRLDERTYFAKHRKPGGGGVVDWNEPGAGITRLIRACDFGPVPNSFASAKVLAEAGTLIVRRARFASSPQTAPPGTVLSVSPYLSVAVADGFIEINELVTLKGEPLTADRLSAWGIVVGTRLPMIDAGEAAGLGERFTALSRRDSFWVGQLSALDPVSPPAPGACEWVTVDFPVPAVWNGEAWIWKLAVTAAFFSRFATDGKGHLAWSPGFETDLSTDLFGGNPVPVPLPSDRFASASGFAAHLKRYLIPLDGAIASPDLAARHPSIRATLRSLSGDAFPVRCRAAEGDRFEVCLPPILARPLVRFAHDCAAEPDGRCAMFGLADAESGPHADEDRAPSVSVVDVFREVASRFPDAVALSAAERNMTYRELDDLSDRIAVSLGECDSTGDFVGVAMERGVGQIVMMLSVLKSGAAYLPLDPAWPLERLKVIADEARLRTVVVDTSVPESIRRLECRLFKLDDLADSDTDADRSQDRSASPKPSDLAYVMFTSGSTGVPKGVCVGHRSIVRLVRKPNYCALSADERVLNFAPISFDASTFEIWSALLNGGTLVIADAGSPDLDALAETIRGRGITTLWLTAGLFHQMVDEQLDCFAGVRQLLAGGDVLSASHVRRFKETHPGVRLINGYGPTENTTFTCCHTVTAQDLSGGAIPIGRPVNGTRLFVLDRHRSPLPRGVFGELHVGGPGLARGYLGQADLTAERFTEIEIAGRRERVYRTGDLALVRDDGIVEFGGRVDQQVKVNGYRIELEEIEAVLCSHPDVLRAAAQVVAGDDGQKLLVAFHVARSGRGIGEDDLRNFAASRLPRYMVPHVFRAVDSLPLNANGKVDRRGLRGIDLFRTEREVDEFHPGDAVEEALLEMWRDVLHVGRIGGDETFLSLGGHSLKAMRLASMVGERFGVKLPIAIVFERSTLRSLASWISKAAATGCSDARVGRADRSRPLPLASNQRALWVLWRLDPSSPVYNVAHAVTLRGDVSEAAVRGALRAMVARHEILRSAIREIDGEPFHIIDDHVELTLPVDDVSLNPDAAVKIAREEAGKPFDLTVPGLFRFRLLGIGSDRLKLIAVFHHIVADGESVRLFVEELDARLRGAEPDPPDGPSFPDFACRESTAADSEETRDHRAFWSDMLGRTSDTLDLPTDRVAATAMAFAGDKVGIGFTVGESEAIAKVCDDLNLTPHAFFLGAYASFLFRYSGQRCVLVGMPVANRGGVGAGRVFGFFANTIALPFDIDPGHPFSEVAVACGDLVRGALAHEMVGIEQVFNSVDKGSAGGAPFRTLFAYEDDVWSAGGDGGIVESVEEIVLPIAKFDLTLEVGKPGNRFRAAFEFRTDLFERETVEAMLQNLRLFASAAAADPSTIIKALPVIGESDEQLLERLTGSESRKVPGPTVLDTLGERVAGISDRLAVVGTNRSWTYGELDREARTVGRFLRSLGAKRDSVVGLALPRSGELVVAALGILHAGAAFLPIDPSNPDERVARLVEDSNALCLMTDADRFAGLPIRRVTVGEAVMEDCEELLPPHDAEALAYVIYTSGSTGVPKGVCVGHAPLMNHNVAIRSAFGLTSDDVVLQFASPGFDVAWEEVLTTLTAGARLVPCTPPMLESHRAFLDAVAGFGITVLNLPTAFWDSLVVEVLENGWEMPRSVRLFVVGGERVGARSIERWQKLGLDHVRLLNGYGPTEATITSTIYEVRNSTNWQTMREVPIGSPLPGVSVRVVDAGMRPVPVGAKGELLLGGACLARGYMGRPDLTDASFVRHGFFGRQPRRYYRTGDVVRVRRDGELEFYGRVDDQIKLRGFRIEPGEIETALLAGDGVKACAVTRHVSGTLVGFFESDSGALVGEELRLRLGSKLPAHMVPDRLVRLDRLPITVNGKIDRRALSSFPLGEADAEVEGFTNDVESGLASLWGELLGVEIQSRRQSFFAMGGHSLTAMRLIARIESRFGVTLPIRDVFEHPALHEIAEEIRRRGGMGKEDREEGFI